jgi:hypothetical protein
VGIAFLAVAALAIFIPLARARRRGWLIAESLVLTLAAGFTLLFSLIVWGLTCDESCDDRSSLWQDDPDAWQWTAQAIVAAAGFVAVISALVFVLVRSYRSAMVAMSLGSGAYATWGIAFFDSF